MPRPLVIFWNQFTLTGSSLLGTIGVITLAWINLIDPDVLAFMSVLTFIFTLAEQSCYEFASPEEEPARLLVAYGLMFLFALGVGLVLVLIFFPFVSTLAWGTVLAVSTIFFVVGNIIATFGERKRLPRKA